MNQCSMNIRFLIFIAFLLSIAFAGSVSAQETGSTQECIELKGTPAGLYATTDEGRTYLSKENELVELGPGEAAFADKDRIACIKRVPHFLDWPCATDAARARMFATYKLEDIEEQNVAKEVVRRYFEIPEVIQPVPRWVDGEFHKEFPLNDLIQFANPQYWYHPDTSRNMFSGKRPKIQLISLYVGINQVVVDQYTLDPLSKEMGADGIPTVFIFQDSNVVPISYFGDNVSIEEVSKAFLERQIKVAEVPMWEEGDYHLLVTIEEFEKHFVDYIPELEDISEAKCVAIETNLKGIGFSQKPLFVTFFAESSAMIVDNPARVRVAQSMGFKRLPTVIFFIEDDQYLQRCGPGTAVGGAPFGSTTPISGPLVPPSADAPAPEPPPSPEPGPEVTASSQ